MTEVSLFSRPRMLPWRCQGPAASYSPCSRIPLPGTGCRIAAGSPVAPILPEGSRPQPFDAVRGLPGARPELVIREGLGDASGRACPIARGSSFMLGGPTHRRGAPGASGAGAFCCTGLSIVLPLLFPPFLPVFPPGPPPSPCPLSAHPGWHSQPLPVRVRSSQCRRHSARHGTRHGSRHSTWHSSQHSTLQPAAGI